MDVEDVSFRPSSLNKVEFQLPNYDEATNAPTHPPKGIEDPPTYMSNTTLNRSFYLPTGYVSFYNSFLPFWRVQAAIS